MITHSSSETEKLGEKLAKKVKKIKKGVVIALYGELGSGKTTFVKGLAKGLGIKKRIISPTFIFIREYSLVARNTKHVTRNFYHIDLYRINEAKDARGLGLEEILVDPQNVVTIEWAEKIKNLLPKKRIDIFFRYLREDKRKITLKMLQ